MICLPFRTRQGMVSNMSNCLPPPHRVGMSPFSFCTQSFYCHVLCYCWHPGRTPLLTPCRGGRLVVVLVGGVTLLPSSQHIVIPDITLLLRRHKVIVAPDIFFFLFFLVCRQSLKERKDNNWDAFPNCLDRGSFIMPGWGSALSQCWDGCRF